MLAATRAVGGVAAAASLVGLAFGHTEHAETVLYWFAFLIALPTCLAADLRRASLLSRAETDRAATTAVALVAGVFIASRAVDAIAGTTAMLGVMLAGMALALAVERRLERRPAIAGATPAALLLGAGAVVSFLPKAAFSAWHLGSVVVVGLCIAAVLHGRARPAPKWLGRTLDICVCLIVSIAVTDLSPYGVRLAYDQDFYLGPVNAILHGSVMLVDTFAQYGVGVMYFLASLFLLVPIGYGGFQLLNDALTAFGLVVIYAVLRLATRRQRDAILGVVVIAVVHFLTGIGPHVQYGSVGWLRFGLPWLVVLSTLVELRRSPRAGYVTLALVGVASIWSFETFVYTAGAWLSFSMVRAVLDGGGVTARRRLRDALVAACLAVLATQLAFALITLAVSGRWPDWAGYLAYVRLYSWGGFGTLLIPSWSLGYLLAAAYAVSFAGLSVALRLSPELCDAFRPELAAIASLSAFGVLSYTYFLGRSHPNNLHHVAPPAIALGIVWLGVLREMPGSSRTALTLISVLAGVAAGLLVMEEPSETRAVLQSSPFGYGVDLPVRTVTRAQALLRERPDTPDVVQAARELGRASPHGSRVAVVLPPAIQTEVLIRANRGNTLPDPIPRQDVLLPTRSLSLVRRNLGRLGRGSVVLTDRAFLAELRKTPRTSLSFQAAILVEIGKRFRYRITALNPPRFALLTIESPR